MCNHHVPVCVTCCRDMMVEKNGVPFVEKGLNNRPYKLWEADKWRCQGCGAQVLVGFGTHPVAVQHEPDFPVKLAAASEDPFIVTERDAP
jgi:hypothetical protein